MTFFKMRLKESATPLVLIIFLRYLIGATFVYAFAWKLGDGLMPNSSIPMTGTDNPVFETFLCIMRIKYLWLAATYLQFIAGVLLLTQRYALLGALLFLPVIFSIFLITWSVDFIGTKYITLLLLIANLILLFWDRHRLSSLFPKTDGTLIIHNRPVPGKLIWEYTGVAIVFVSLLRIVYHFFILWFVACAIISMIGLLFFVLKRHGRGR